MNILSELLKFVMSLDHKALYSAIAVMFILMILLFIIREVKKAIILLVLILMLSGTGFLNNQYNFKIENNAIELTVNGNTVDLGSYKDINGVTFTKQDYSYNVDVSYKNSGKDVKITIPSFAKSALESWLESKDIKVIG